MDLVFSAVAARFYRAWFLRDRRASFPYLPPWDSTISSVMSGASFIKSVTLPSGAQLPVLGLGVFKSEPGQETYDAVKSALALGYRHIDSATYYENEADVGRAIRDLGVPREQLFVTSKFFDLQGWSYEATIAAVQRSLRAFQFEYLDLYLLHAPCKSEGRSEAWRALEDLHQQGLLKDIGVSNFSEAHLQKLSETWRIKPAVNQFEVHPWLSRTALAEYCQQQGIVVQAYSPLTRTKKLNDPVLLQIAADAKATPAQVLIAWGLGKGYVSLPKSVRAERQKENLEAAKLQLSPEHLTKLDALDEYFLSAWDPIKQHEV